VFKLTRRDRNARTVMKKAFDEKRDESDGSSEHRWKCCRRRDYEDSAFLVVFESSSLLRYTQRLL